MVEKPNWHHVFEVVRFRTTEGTSLAIIVELINHFFSGTDPVYTQAKSLFAWMLDALSLW